MNAPSDGETSAANQRKAQFFAEPGVDRLVAVVLNLATELWVHEERLRALEPGDKSPDANTPALKEFIDRIFGPLREG